MNYLILTPDGVGSTILQRLITMALYLEKQTVMNTHELTNGLVHKNGVATKDFTLKYTQNLEQISNIIETSDHSKNKLFRLLKSSVIDSLTPGIKPYLVKNLCGGITASFSS